MTDTERRQDRSRTLLLIAAMAALAALVRLPGMGYPLWVDEIATLVGFVRLPLGELLSSYPSPNHHVLNSALTHLSVAVFGEQPWALRLPAYLFGVAAVPALYLLARSALTRPEALSAAIILALSYHHAYFSQNARGYTGYVFFSVLGTWFLHRALESGSRRDWAGYAVAGTLNVYVLLSGLFVVVAQFVGALLVHVAPPSKDRRGTRLRRLLIWTSVAAALTLLLYLPLMGDLIAFYATADAEVGWSLSGNLLGVIVEATGLPTGSRWLVAAALLLGSPVLVAGSVRLARRMPLAFFAFLLPPLIELTVAGLLGAGSYPRRFILVIPFGILLGVAGVQSLGVMAGELTGRARIRTLVFGAGVAVGCAAVAFPLPRLYSTPKQDFPAALEWLDERTTEDDVRVAAWVAAPPARFFDPAVVPARDRGELDDILRSVDGSIWLLTTMQRDLERFEPELASLIRENFEMRESFPGLVGGGSVLVWERRTDTR